MHRSILALGVAAALAACGEVPTESSAVRPQAAVTRSEQSFRMFRTACNGDLVTLAGMTKITRVERDGVQIVTLDSEGQGAGQLATYSITWLRTMRFVAGGATTETSTELLRLRGDGVPDTFIRGVTATTIQPDGSVAVAIDFTDEACRGR